MRHYRLFGLLILFTLFVVACRSADKATQICEQNNRNCHQGCNMANANFSQTKTAHQSVSECDVRCEKNYQSCLKRSENPGIRIIDDGSER